MGNCCASHNLEKVELLHQCNAPGVIFREEIRDINKSRRNVVSWLPETNEPSGIVLISHGLNEHSLRYYRLAIELAQIGFGVYSIDHVSHGKSDGVRSVIVDYRIMLDDFAVFGNSIHEQYQELPLFLMAHSMGSMIGIMTASRIAGLQAVVLSGVPLFPGPGASSPLGMQCLYPLSQTWMAPYIARAGATVAPAGLLAPLIVKELTSDPVELQQLAADPRVCPPYISNRSGYELLKLSVLAKAEVTRLPASLSLLCIHGSEDAIALPRGSEFVFEHAQCDRARKRLHKVAGALHEPFHEREPLRSDAIACVTDFFQQQLHLYLRRPPPPPLLSSSLPTTAATSESNIQLISQPIATNAGTDTDVVPTDTV